MARVTVEDCVQKIPNRFELVMMAAQRGRELSAGAPLTLDRDNDKNPVVALREIADETISLDGLRDALVKGHQKHVEPDEPEEDIVELMAGEQGWIAPTDENQSEEPVADEDPEDAYDAMEQDPDRAFEGEEEGLTDQVVNERGDGSEYD